MSFDGAMGRGIVKADAEVLFVGEEREESDENG